MVYGTTDSNASRLFQAAVPVFPDIYIFLDNNGSKELRQVTINGNYAELGKPYLVKKEQSIEMVLNALNNEFFHKRFPNSDMPRKETYPTNVTIADIVYGPDAINYLYAPVYVISLQKIRAIANQDIVNLLVRLDNCILTQLGQNIKAYAYTRNIDKNYEFERVSIHVPSAMVH